MPHAHGDLPGLLGHVHLLEDPQAVLAVAALGGGVLPKVVEDVLPQAAGGVAIAYHGLEPGLVLLVELLQGLHVPALHGVGQAVLDMVLQYDLGGVVEGGAHRGELDQHLGAVAPVLDHLAHGLEVAYRAREAVQNGLGLRVRVLVLVAVRILHAVRPYVRMRMLAHAINSHELILRYPGPFCQARRGPGF